MDRYTKMLNAAKETKTFMDAVVWRDDLEPLLWRIYACAIQSELADSWDGEKRLDVFWLFDDIIKLLLNMLRLSCELEPALETIMKKYEDKKRLKKHDKS